jgi:hypothetical protein
VTTLFGNGGSLGAAILVSLAFSLLIRGATRSTEHRRQGRTLAASLYVGMAVIGLAGCLATLVVGLLIMTQK